MTQDITTLHTINILVRLNFSEFPAYPLN